MSILRLDGKVAIVTGAGGNPGLGRSYAIALAERGAKVVVNDLGVGPDGRGALRAHADAVVAEIISAGGEAVADTHSVAEEDNAKSIVQTALDEFGGIDILVNNAGVFNGALFEEVSSKDLLRMVQVHLYGNIWMCRAVWPHMKEQRYGRVINICSGSMLGAENGVVYGTAKSGIYGLTRGLAVEGREFGVKVNAFSPVAFTAGADHSFDELTIPGVEFADLDPDRVAPGVVYLAHEECAVSGKFISSGIGHISEMYFSETAGYSDPSPTPEDIRENLTLITDRSRAHAIPDPGSVTSGVIATPRQYQP